MPSVPDNRTCSILGCHKPKTFRSGYCADHGGGQTLKAKENAKLYNSARWKATREQQRSLHPLCARCLCEGRVTQTAHIDHVFPHRRDQARFMANLFQGLCHSCHTMKTTEENKGVVQHWTEHGLVEYVEADYGYVMANKKSSEQNPESSE